MRHILMLNILSLYQAIWTDLALVLHYNWDMDYGSDLGWYLRISMPTLEGKDMKTNKQIIIRANKN